MGMKIWSNDEKNRKSHQKSRNYKCMYSHITITIYTHIYVYVYIYIFVCLCVYTAIVIRCREKDTHWTGLIRADWR